MISFYWRPEKKNHKMKLSCYTKTQEEKKNQMEKQWEAKTVHFMAGVQLNSMQIPGVSHIARVFYNK